MLLGRSMNVFDWHSHMGNRTWESVEHDSRLGTNGILSTSRRASSGAPQRML